MSLRPATTPIQDVTDPQPAAAARRQAMTLPFDPILLLAVIGLCVGSLITIAGATADDIPGQPRYYFDRQLMFFIVGLVVALVLSRIDYSRLREIKYGVYGVLIAMIIAVQFLGSVARGSRRSIELPFFSFQASELGKVLLIVALSAYIVDRSRRLNSRDTTTRIMLMTLIPAALVIIQPDLGSGLVYIVIGLATLFVAGSSWRHFAALFVLGAVAIALTLVVAPKMGVTVLHDYQKQRLTAFLSPSENPADQGYQQNQSRIAIGSGEKTGRGEEATQTKLNFLPEHHTDFIFAVVGERWGFVGAAFVLSMYALVIWRGLRILTVSKNLFGAIVAGGIVAMLMFQVFVNVGMNVGIMPITGIPLPLFSYGGSSVLTTFLAVGLLQSIYAQGRASAALKGRVLAF
ncbi:MAG: rod shape determining protein RodA [Solirubrobacteraceae bacterium]|jgi:rod shape determining protein RodA|nr:rod shape determining protein RodA [Solirubrobacteraceae bacterium]MEA2316435.1 rod shape determining protein RodA [Solirubrobacteraceae bacterium]